MPMDASTLNLVEALNKIASEIVRLREEVRLLKERFSPREDGER